MEFYVYLIYRKSEPLYRYVGKGSGDRVFQSLKQREGTNFRIVFRTTDESSAFRMEDYLWCQLRRRGFTVQVGRPGRTGQLSHTGHTFTEEQRRRIGEGVRRAYATTDAQEKRLASLLLPEARIRNGVTQRKVQNLPAVAEKKSASQKLAVADPLVRAAIAAGVSHTMADPTVKERHRHACIQAQQRRLAARLATTQPTGGRSSWI